MRTTIDTTHQQLTTSHQHSYSPINATEELRAGTLDRPHDISSIIAATSACMLSSNCDSDGFRHSVEEQVAHFESAAAFRLLDSSKFTLPHYHSLLSTLFHQTQSGPYTFARAAANTTWKHEIIKEHLLKHAEEERPHWRWVIEDLASTGYAGADPRDQFPHHTTSAFLSFNFYVAEVAPFARLAIACVLEGIGARFGAVYGRELISQLNLVPTQASFFISHGQTDTVHAQDLMNVIENSQLSPEEWGWMRYASSTGGRLYRSMYDHESFM